MIHPYIYIGCEPIYSDIMNNKFLNVDIIMNRVCSFLKISREDLMQKTNRIKSVKARQICMYFIIKYLKCTYKTTGDYFKKDHSTVVHSLKAINNYLETDNDMRKIINNIDKMLKY